jgi:hypothetical protein
MDALPQPRHWNRSILVVFGRSIGAAGGVGLNLADAGRHREISDGGVLGLAGAVRYVGVVSASPGHVAGYHLKCAVAPFRRTPKAWPCCHALAGPGSLGSNTGVRYVNELAHLDDV